MKELISEVTVRQWVLFLQHYTTLQRTKSLSTSLPPLAKVVEIKMNQKRFWERSNVLAMPLGLPVRRRWSRVVVSGSGGSPSSSLRSGSGSDKSLCCMNKTHWFSLAAGATPFDYNCRFCVCVVQTWFRQKAPPDLRARSVPVKWPAMLFCQGTDCKPIQTTAGSVVLSFPMIKLM